MQMDTGLDTGDIWSHHPCMITSDDTAKSLHDRLALLGAETLMAHLQSCHPPFLSELRRTRQNNTLATYAAKLTKSEGVMDWSLSALDLERRVRAFNPWPIAYTHLHAQALRIWGACTVREKNFSLLQNPGTILSATSAGIDVATGDGILRLLSIQLPGGIPLTAAEFLNAHPPAALIGLRLGIVET
ncbi:MAG: methionyl-tRNA formyltransferase, partial [Gammaproteobacteria bacterium]